jgi:hypothetical protein
MRIAAHVLTYNVNRFIAPVLKNMAPFVDKIFVAYSRLPFGYGAQARETRTNPTSLELIQLASAGINVEIVQGDWMDEESARNACLDQAKVQEFDWLITQDADEFYPEENWQRIRKVLSCNPEQEHFRTSWFNFWKNSDFALVDEKGSIKQENAGFALRCLPHLKFINKRRTNASSSVLIDEPCYHYGYAMSDAEMLEKMTTWAHAGEFDAQRWYRLKWLNWNRNTRYLHPTDPTCWPKAIPFPLKQPGFTSQFSDAILPRTDLSIGARADEAFFNAGAWAYSGARRLKGRLRAVFGSGRPQ